MWHSNDILAFSTSHGHLTRRRSAYKFQRHRHQVSIVSEVMNVACNGVPSFPEAKRNHVAEQRSPVGKRLTLLSLGEECFSSIKRSVSATFVGSVSCRTLFNEEWSKL